MKILSVLIAACLLCAGVVSAQQQRGTLVNLKQTKLKNGSAVEVLDSDGKLVSSAVKTSAVSAPASTDKADFAGTWTLDKNNSEGLPPGMDQVMTVVQAGDKLSLETKLITDEGEQVVPDSYTLDGKETEFSPKAPNGQTGKGTRTAKWTSDGNGIEVNEKTIFFGPEGPATVQMTRKWMLSSDGKTLRIEIVADGPQGKQQVKRTFIRK